MSYPPEPPKDGGYPPPGGPPPNFPPPNFPPPGGPPPGGYPPPENNLVWAILSTVFCCLPLGIVAIVKASKVQGLWFSGQFAEAQQAAADAKKFALIGAVVGVVVIVLYIVVVVVVTMAQIGSM